MKDNSYFYGLDFLRAVLMLIGVLIHYASMTSPYHEWRYHSYLHENVFLYHVIYFTHFFRMETFFLLAGFFSLLLCEKRGKKQFLENRRKRVLRPLFFSCLTVSMLSFLLSFYIYGEVEISLNNLIMHFWFLLTLFIISLIFYFSNFYKKVINKEFKFIVFSSFVILIILLFFRFLFVKYFGTDTLVFQVFNYFLFNTAYFGVFFFLGWFFFYNKDKLKIFLINKIYIIIVIFLLLMLCAYFNYYTLELGEGGIYQVFAQRFLEVGTSLVVSIGLFWVFYDLKIYGSTIKYLVDSSIIVYIFHVLFLIFFGFLFDHYILSDMFYFFTVVFLTYLFSFLTYEVVKRNQTLCSMYGLKKK